MRVRDVMTRRVRSLIEDDTTELATAVLLFWHSERPHGRSGCSR